MVWFVILALGVGLWVEHRRVGALSDELARLRQALESLSARADPAPLRPAEPAAAAPVVLAPAAPAVGIVAGPAALIEVPPPVQPPVEPAPAALPASPPAPPGPSVSEWLAEHGLAWIGGGALALGGLFLVAYAAQQGVFTPPLRIAAAVVLGALMLGTGEAIRRGRVTGLHPLAAAMASGAGAATLYAAIWASQALYGFIGVPAAAVLLTAVSVGLLGLALLHGEPLAILALAGGYAAPLVNRPERWGEGALTGFLLLILATGLSAAAQRRWSRAGLVAVAGAAAWGLAALAGSELRAMALALAPLGGALLAAEVAARRPGSGLTGPLSLAVAAAAILSVGLWWAQAAGAYAHPTLPGQSGPALASALLAALAGLAIARGRLSPRAFWVLSGALLLGASTTLIPRGPLHPPGEAAWPLAAAGALALAGLLSGAAQAAVAAAVATAVLLALLRLAGLGGQGWSAAAEPALGALGLLAGAAWLARRSPDPAHDRTTGVWVGAAAAAGLLAIQAAGGGGDGRWGAPSFAVFALALAGLAVRPGWRGFSESAVAAAICALAVLLGRSAQLALTSAQSSFIPVAVAAFGTALLLLGARTLLARRGERAAAAAEALWAGSLIAGLTGVFLLLRMAALPRGAGSASLDPLTEASLRTLLLLAAGLLAQGRAGESRWSAWRGPVLLGAGLLHGGLTQGLAVNPLWGAGGVVSGPPLIDALALAFLAPAALLAAISRRPGPTRRPAAVAALIAALLWTGLELRRLFHGPALASPGVSTPELAAYAVAALASAWALMRLTARWPRPAVARTAEGAAWTALAASVVLLGWLASPWWGPVDTPLRSGGEAVALLGLYAAAVVVLVDLARGWRGTARLAASLRVGAAAAGFALLTLLVRCGFRGADMREALREAGVETWTFSAVWAAYGLGLLVLGVRGRDGAVRGAGLAVLLGASAKVLLFDMARLQGVLRAASFLALGALLLAGALAARRLARREPGA